MRHLRKFSIFNFQFSIDSGFTLIELLVAIAIVGILSTLGLFLYTNGLIKARDAQRKHDGAQVQTALQLYYNDNQKYPVSGWIAVNGSTDFLNSTLISGNYEKSAFVDPKNSGYFQYNYHSLDTPTPGSGYQFEIRYENSNETDATGWHTASDGSGATSTLSCWNSAKGGCPYKFFTNP